MLNTVVITDGQWDNCTLLCDGKEVSASRLFVNLKTERSILTDKIVRRTVETTVTSLSMVGDTPAYGNTVSNLLPGIIDCTFPLGKVIVKCSDPTIDPNSVTVEYDGVDITEYVNSLVVDVDSPADKITAYLTLFKGHPIPIFGKDTLTTVNLFG